MQIRRADASDSQLLAQLNHQLIRDEGHRNPMSAAELETRMIRWLDGQYEAHIFSVEGQSVGYVLACNKAEHVYVRQFFILPEFRRRGLGRSAFQWMLDNVWKDSDRLRLDVLVGNKGGIAFWRSLGFSDYCLTMEAKTSLKERVSCANE